MSDDRTFEEAKALIEANHNKVIVFRDDLGNYRIAYWAEGIKAVVRTDAFPSKAIAEIVCGRDELSLMN